MANQETTIPKGWKMTTLGEMAELSKDQWKSGDAGQKYIGLEHINQGDLTINSFGSSSKLNSNKFYFKKDDVLFGKLRPYFRKVWRAKFEGVCSTEIWVIRAKVNNDQVFLFYFAANPVFVDKSMGASKGTHMPRADWDYLKNTEWLLPSLPEQRAIAAVLSSLDDKIELLREQNKTLETTAQTIFKEWFVNFNYPGATGKMIDSELGKIPEGWRVGNLGEVIEIFDSKRVPLASDVRAQRKGIFPYYGATSIMDYIDDYLFDGTYLLLAEDGSVMDENGCPVLQYVWGKFWVSNHSHVLQGKNGFSTEILYVFLKKTNITGIVNGAVQLKINQTNLVNFEILIPQKNILEKFNSALHSIFEKIKNIQHQIQTISTLRDTLLPKLMKGEVRVEGFNKKEYE